jgi:hypothetical protein
MEINRGINAFRSARDNATAGRGEGPSRRSPRRAAPPTAVNSVARRVEELPPSVRFPVSSRVSSLGRVQAPAPNAAPASMTGIQAPAVSTGSSAPAPRAGSADTTSSVRGAVPARDIQGHGMTAAVRGVASAGVAGRVGFGRGSAGRMAPRGTSGSSRPIPAGLPPSAPRPVRPTPTTTSRTGLTEVQLREISSTIKRSNTPSFSETVNKRRRLDVAIERNSDFLSRQDNDASGSGGDNFMQMLLLQNIQRDARAEEFRHQEIMRAEKRQEEVERREELERARQEQRREEQLEREDNRRRDDMEREERREKSEIARSQMMFMFMNQNRNEDK